MAFKYETTLAIKERVLQVRNRLVATTNIDPSQASSIVWNRIRSQLDKSYSDCDESDLPVVMVAIKSIEEEYNAI